MSKPAVAVKQEFNANACSLEQELAELLVFTLHLDMEPEEIDPEVALFGAGLGLDSIDILELSMMISKRYGVHLRADDQDNLRFLGSLRSLAEHIALLRTR
jgi:acyl carrier protein